MNFLDVLMKKSGDSFITSVYRKSTHTGRYLHFSSNHLFTQRMAGVATLKYRAEYYCSSPDLLRAELSHLHEDFLKNGIPGNILSKYLYAKKNAQKPQEEQKYKGTLVLPYIKELHNPLQNLCKRTEVKLLYKRSRNLGNILTSHRPKR